MKRLIPVAIILALIVFMTVYSSIKIDRSAGELTALLGRSRVQVQAGLYDDAKQTLKDYFQVLERDELFYRFFMRRDLYNNIVLYPSQLDALATEDHRYDFDAQAAFSQQQIELYRKMMLKPA